MGSDSEAQESRVLRQEVDRAIVEAREARSDYHITASTGGVDEHTAYQLRSAAIRLYNTLSQWQSRDEVQEIWTDHGIDKFADMLNTTIQTRQAHNSRLSAGRDESKTQLAVAQLSPDQLSTVIEGLLETAKELGFAPETRERTPLEKGTVTDIRWLVNTRDQDKAVDELTPPENDAEEVRADGGVAATSANEPRLTADTDSIKRFPFRGPFFQLVSDRKEKGQDVKITVASANAETGVSKSTCAFYLAHVLDTSPGGFVAEDKSTLRIKDYLRTYNSEAKGSAVILDEAEQLTGRRATSKKNVKTSEKLQMNRVKEITAFFTLPKFNVLDPLLQDLMDFRIEVERLGLATIYRKQHSPFSGTWWQEIQRFEYPDMDWAPGMQALHDTKDDFLDADEDDLMSESEAEQQADKEATNAAREMRNQTIRDLSENGWKYDEIRELLVERVEAGVMDEDLLVTTQRIGQIARGD